MTLRHVVLLKFKPEAAAADIARVESAFAALPSQIADVHSLEWGTNASPEGLDHGFTLSFASTSACNAYLVHPRHQAFSALAKPHLDDVLVIDYET